LTSGRVFELAYGGEEKFTISLANWLTKLKHDVTLMGSGFASVKTQRVSESVVVEQDIKKLRTEQKKIRVLYPPYLIYLLSRFVMSVLWILKISSINMKLPITIIHAQDTGYTGLAAVLSGKLLRIPVIVSSHGIRHKTLESTIRGRLRSILLKIEYKLDIFTIKNADSVIAVNPSIKKYFEQITSREIDYIPIGIKVSNFEFSELNRTLIRNELGIDEKTKVLGFVGRFSLEKNLLTLLESFANVVQDNSVLKLVLVGAGGPLEHHFREYISKRGIEDKVIICGIRYDIDRILSSFDIFILPSYTEGLSTALLEAMACGRAIICSDILANQELVTHNKEALLVNPHKIEGFERAIELLCKDETLRTKLGSNAKIKASQYNEEAVLPKILQHYEILHKKKIN
jgi:glycosyltransferase involved in cell wall biosynthesis